MQRSVRISLARHGTLSQYFTGTVPGMVVFENERRTCLAKEMITETSEKKGAEY